MRVRLTSRAQARGTKMREPRSGTGLSRQSVASAEAAIPRCLQRFVSWHLHHLTPNAIPKNTTGKVKSTAAGKASIKAPCRKRRVLHKAQSEMSIRFQRLHSKANKIAECPLSRIHIASINKRHWTMSESVNLEKRFICQLTKKAEPPPTGGVNRDSGTDRANGGWLRRLVRRHISAIPQPI